MTSQEALPTQLFQVLRQSEEGKKKQIQCVIEELFRVNHIQRNDYRHYLKTYSEYNKLSDDDQVEYVLNFFRSKIGYSLIHEMFLAQPVDFNGIIDLHNNNKKVKQILENFGIDKNLEEKRDKYLIMFLQITYVKAASYIVKTKAPDYHHYDDLTLKELLFFHIWEGDIESEEALDELYNLWEFLKCKDKNNKHI